jgi:hypothetical protein
MVSIYKRAKKEANYNANRFLQMISEPGGGYAAAKKLIVQDGGSDGFTNLWGLQRLDLTVEAVVIKEEYSSLFTPNEIELCKKRLSDYGYKSDS